MIGIGNPLWFMGTSPALVQRAAILHGTVWYMRTYDTPENAGTVDTVAPRWHVSTNGPQSEGWCRYARTRDLVQAQSLQSNGHRRLASVYAEVQDAPQGLHGSTNAQTPIPPQVQK